MESQNYKILSGDFKDFSEGDIVPGHRLGDVKYLMSIGFIEESKKPQFIAREDASPEAMKAKAEEAVAEATQEIEDLKAKIKAKDDIIEGQKKTIGDKNTEIEDLKKKLAEAKKPAS